MSTPFWHLGAHCTHLIQCPLQFSQFLFATKFVVCNVGLVQLEANQTKLDGPLLICGTVDFHEGMVFVNAGELVQWKG
jgi:hypothetical protein